MDYPGQRRFHGDHQQDQPLMANDIVMHVNPAMQGQSPPNFELSTCQGRKRALLIGINYYGTSNELKGCINDVKNIKQFLETLYSFREEDMVILTDNQTEARFIPTKENIKNAMNWLVHDAKPNDSFFFHFSGHGGRVRDSNSDEDDGWDETIYPVDHFEFPGDSGLINDDDHGTVLDLPYVYSTRGEVKQQNIFKDAGGGLLNAGLQYAAGNVEGAISAVIALGTKLANNKKVDERIKAFKRSEADVIMFSGCKDEQTSADSVKNGQSTGAMSYAFTTGLRKNKNQSFVQLLNSVRVILRDEYSQRPQLSSSHPIDVNLLFIL